MYSPVIVKENVSGVLFYSPSTVESYMQENSTSIMTKRFQLLSMASQSLIDKILDNQTTLMN